MAVAVSNVELIVSAAKAVNPLKRVQKEALTVEQRLKKTNEATRKVAQAFQFMGNRAKRALRDAESGAAQLGKRMRTVGTAVKAAGVAFAAYKAIQVGLSRVESERRLKLLARGYGEVAELQAAASVAASKFNLSQTEANQGIANAYARLRPLGVTLKDITSTFGGFRTAAVLGGATAQEASAAFTQLSQALGSGALRGDEFRSVSEQAPLVLQAISDETGIAAGNLKDFAKEGLITSDIVIKALKRIEKDGAGKLEEALGGPAAKIKDFQNAVEDVAVAATETIIPQLSTAFTDLAQIIRDLEGPIRFIGGLVGGLVEKIGKATTRFRRGGAAVAQAEMRATEATRRQLPDVGVNDQAFLDLYEKELNRRLAKLDGQVFGQLPPSAAVLPGEEKKKPPTILKPPGDTKDAEDAEKLLKKQLESGAKLSQQFTRQIQLKKASSEIARKELQIEFDRQDALAEIAATTAISQQAGLNELANEAAILEVEKARDELAVERQNREQEREKKAAEAAQRLIEADPGYQMRIQFEELIKLENQVAAGATAIGSAFSNAFVGVISGAKSAQQGLAEMMQSVAQHFLDMATKIIAQQLAMILYGTIMKALGVSMPGGGGGFNPFAPSITGNSISDFGGGHFAGFANGGRPPVGRPSMVGERGPELFVPGTSGTIIPNHALGGGANVTVNVDASGSSVEGDSDQASQLGKMLGAAVQAELIKQKRPGGLLSS